MKYLDLDKNEPWEVEKFIQHLQTHDEAYFRYSSSGNCHGIVDNLCNDCYNFIDDMYNGKILFNNKGNYWACKFKDVHTWKKVEIDAKPVIVMMTREFPRFEFVGQLDYFPEVRYMWYCFASIITEIEGDFTTTFHVIDKDDDREGSIAGHIMKFYMKPRLYNLNEDFAKAKPILEKIWAKI